MRSDRWTLSLTQCGFCDVCKDSGIIIITININIVVIVIIDAGRLIMIVIGVVAVKQLNASIADDRIGGCW